MIDFRIDELGVASRCGALGLPAVPAYIKGVTRKPICVPELMICRTRRSQYGR
jgi:hypothetical protein